MRRDILGFVFTFVVVIEPDRSLRGEVLEFLPQSRYRTALDRVSIDTDIAPFAAFIAERVRWSMETTAKGGAEGVRDRG